MANECWLVWSDGHMSVLLNPDRRLMLIFGEPMTLACMRYRLMSHGLVLGGEVHMTCMFCKVVHGVQKNVNV